MLVRHEFAYISLSSENHRIAKKHLFWPYELIFRLFEKHFKMTPDFFDEKSKTGLGFKIGQQ